MPWVMVVGFRDFVTYDTHLLVLCTESQGSKDLGNISQMLL